MICRLDTRQWRPVSVPLQNRPGARSPEQLRAVLAQFDVTREQRYQPTALATWCNIYVWDATTALGCEIPHWIGEGKQRRELSANGIVEWLEIVGSRAGWRGVDQATATLRANAGFPCVAAWKNPGKGSGHVAMLVPSSGPTRIAQAGRVCLFDAPLSKGFGAHQPTYWTHD